jgi:hypothetical protein
VKNSDLEYFSSEFPICVVRWYSSFDTGYQTIENRNDTINFEYCWAHPISVLYKRLISDDI